MNQDTITVDPPQQQERSPLLDPVLDRSRAELVGQLRRLTGDLEGSMETVIPGLHLHRVMNPGGPKHAVQTAAFAVIAQGSKRLLVGDEVYEYDSMHYLVTSVDLPVLGKVTVASPNQPYLGLRLDLDVGTVAELLRDGNVTCDGGGEERRGLYVNRLGPLLLDAVLRLLRLLEAPADIPVLAPMVKREIFYRLLMGGEGCRLRAIALQDSQTQRVARAIGLLRGNFAEPLRVDAIAREVHMSLSSLHHHFKAVTAMSPLQYQKQLRLQEARRLILLGQGDVAAVAHQVGYESASQFSREYSRMFGLAPSRDRRRWREGDGAE